MSIDDIIARRRSAIKKSKKPVKDASAKRPRSESGDSSSDGDDESDESEEDAESWAGVESDAENDSEGSFGSPTLSMCSYCSGRFLILSFSCIRGRIRNGSCPRGRS